LPSRSQLSWSLEPQHPRPSSYWLVAGASSCRALSWRAYRLLLLVYPWKRRLRLEQASSVELLPS